MGRCRRLTLVASPPTPPRRRCCSHNRPLYTTRRRRWVRFDPGAAVAALADPVQPPGSAGETATTVAEQQAGPAAVTGAAGTGTSPGGVAEAVAPAGPHSGARPCRHRKPEPVGGRRDRGAAHQGPAGRRGAAGLLVTEAQLPTAERQRGPRQRAGRRGRRHYPRRPAISCRADRVDSPGVRPERRHRYRRRRCGRRRGEGPIAAALAAGRAPAMAAAGKATA